MTETPYNMAREYAYFGEETTFVSIPPRISNVPCAAIEPRAPKLSTLRKTQSGDKPLAFFGPSRLKNEQNLKTTAEETRDDDEKGCLELIQISEAGSEVEY
ncbi:hypothetical protein TMatcc_007015 [Talaromyces marneffei ATCC 18224]